MSCSTSVIRHTLRGGRNGLGRREKWPKIEGRMEKSGGGEFREKGENEMLGVGRDG